MSFFKVNFEDDSRGKYLELLGYRKEDLGKKVNFGGSFKGCAYTSEIFR